MVLTVGLLSVMISWLKGFNGYYVGKRSCFRKIHTRVFRGDGALSFQLAFKQFTKRTNENVKRRLWSSCDDMPIAGESEEELEFFVSYFQIFCWFKIIKRQIIKK